MEQFMRTKNSDRRSLLKPKRSLFGKKKADRSDSEPRRKSLFRNRNKKKEAIFDLTPPPTPDASSPLHATILTHSCSPSRSNNFGEEGSIDDTISDLSASILLTAPNHPNLISAVVKPEVESTESTAFQSHRGSEKDKEEAQTTRFDFLTSMVDGVCSIPRWPGVGTSANEAMGTSWGVAPSVDDDDTVLNPGQVTSFDETVPAGIDNLDPRTEVTSETSPEPDEQEGYELVLDPTNEHGKSKKNGPLWKLANKAKSDEKGAIAEVVTLEQDDGASNKCTSSFLKILSNGRTKTPEPNHEPKMINLSEEVLNPEDLLDEEGEASEMSFSLSLSTPPSTTNPTSGKTRPDSSFLQPIVEAAEPAVHKSKAIKTDDNKPEIPLTQAVHSSSWNLTALKNTLSGAVTTKEVDEVNTSAEGSSLLSFLTSPAASPKKETPPRPKPEGPRLPKPVWKVAEDPNSGLTYYYHRITRVTTWTKPSDFDAPPPTEPAESAVSRSLSAQHQKKLEEGVEVPTSDNPTSILRKKSRSGVSVGSSHVHYTKKQQEIKSLLLSMSPPDPASADKIIDEYRGREEELLEKLSEIVESQPFDEPIKIAEGGKRKSFQLPPRPVNSLRRVITASSNFTGKTSKTGHSKQTIKAGNTATARLYPASKEKENEDLNDTLVSSNQTKIDLDATPVKEKPTTDEGTTPVKVVKAPRNRELLVEEFSSGRYGLRTEGYIGKATRQNASRRKAPSRELVEASRRTALANDSSYDGDGSELQESFATDSVSGLSASQPGDFVPRKDEYEAAARSALGDAIRNNDWELAATVAEEMRGVHHVTALNESTPGEWTQSSLDKFIAENDWDAVAKYAASMRDRNERKTPAGPARKKFGARSQLQHIELEKHQEMNGSTSSWDSRSSFGSEFYSSASSQSPSPQRKIPQRKQDRKEFAC